MRTHRFTVPLKFLLPFFCLTIFIVQLGLSVGGLPSMKLTQDIICKSHPNLPLSGALLAEEDCHDDTVQRELNLINTGILVSVSIGGALVAFPMGLLADRIGRVPVLSLAILGLFLSSTYSMAVLFKAESIPIRALWGTGAWLLLGGGRSVAEAVVFAIISDVVPEQKRATWFQCVVAAAMTAQILGPLVSRELMTDSVWTPLWLSLGCILLGGLLIAGLTPETLHVRPETSLDDDDDREPRTKTTLRSLLRKPLVYLIPAATLTIPLATISYLLRKKNAIKRDISLLQSCTFFLVLGSLLFMMITSSSYFIAGAVITALASGTTTLSRALMVSFSPNPSRTGSLFGVLAVGEIIGFLVCQLGMGALFDAGLDKWMGLPFGMGFLLALVIGTATWMVKEPKIVKEIEDVESALGDNRSHLGSLERYQLDLKI